MDLATHLVEKHFGSDRGELCLDGVPASKIAASQGTPVFIYGKSILDRKWHLLSHTFPEGFSICYSVKANPNRVFLQYFLSKGCGLEIASGGEFHQAVVAGCPAEKIIFAGPGKTEAELEMVLEAGVGEIHVESSLEIDRISRITREHGWPPARVALRVNPSKEAQGGAMRMGGKSAPFGIDEEAIEPLMDRIVADPSLDFRGIHLFTGTQILDYSVLLTQYNRGIEIARNVAARLGKAIHTLDFGGGLGIPYFTNEHELDMNLLGDGLQALIGQVRRDPIFAETRFVVEPGRFLVGESGVYVVRVNDIKHSRGKKYLVVDGGMNHHLAASGNLGQTIKKNYPVAVLNRLNEAVREEVDVVGPLCTPLDVLARSIQLPRVEVGDLVGILQSGAYARSASPLGFLSHMTPPEVWVENGVQYLVRNRGSYDDFCRDLQDLPNRSAIQKETQLCFAPEPSNSRKA